MTERFQISATLPLAVKLSDAPAVRVMLGQPVMLTSLQPVSQPVSIGPMGAPSLQVLQALMGPAGQVEIEAVETLPAGSDAEIINHGEPSHARLLIKLPRGEKGEPTEWQQTEW